MSEDRTTGEPSSNPDAPDWAAQPGHAERSQPQPWERTPPPPPGAQLEPGEQSQTAVREEQHTGEISNYNERGISATDAEMGAEGAQPGAGQGAGASGAAEPQQVGGFIHKWQAVQAQFVDDPRRAVEQADQFFEEVVRKLEEERRQLRGLWDRGEQQSSTEDLRVAMQRYRDYFQQRLG